MHVAVCPKNDDMVCGCCGNQWPGDAWLLAWRKRVDLVGCSDACVSAFWLAFCSASDVCPRLRTHPQCANFMVLPVPEEVRSSGAKGGRRLAQYPCSSGYCCCADATNLIGCVDCYPQKTCFPAEATVEVEGRGTVPMRSVEYGDRVSKWHGARTLWGGGRRRGQPAAASHAWLHWEP